MKLKQLLEKTPYEVAANEDGYVYATDGDRFYGIPLVDEAIVIPGHKLLPHYLAAEWISAEDMVKYKVKFVMPDVLLRKLVKVKPRPVGTKFGL